MPCPSGLVALKPLRNQSNPVIYKNILVAAIQNLDAGTKTMHFDLKSHSNLRPIQPANYLVQPAAAQRTASTHHLRDDGIRDARRGETAVAICESLLAA